MMNPVWTFLIAGPLLWVASWAWALYSNYRAAKLSGLPILISPFSPDKLPYLLLKVPLRPILETLLPFPGVVVSIVGWEVRDKYRIHERYGPAFILVSPDKNELWCADPDMTQSILSRRRDFPQLPMTITIMSAFGTNMLTSNGEDWSRQRRIVGPNLNERISEGVWSESMTQAHQMVDYMLRQPGGASAETSDAMRAIAINVLGEVGYGQSKPFAPLKLPRDPNADLTYVEAISLCAELIVVAVFVPKWLMRLSWMPDILKTLATALDKLPGLTSKMLEMRRKEGVHLSAAAGGKMNDDFMSMLVRLSDAGKGGDAAGAAGGKQSLTEDEIGGNLFLFTAAGFDTTANTLTYAMTILAATPEWQAWMQEEIDQVLGKGDDDDARNYVAVYPKLSRCLAVMFETLRLHAPVPHIGRSIPHPTSIEVRGKTHQLPGRSILYINETCMQVLPSIWGADSLEFKPSRWIEPGGELGAEKLVTPERNTFLPWSGGPRVCPGQKMAQVEFVTVMAATFSRCRVEPVAKGARRQRRRRRD
ncbi:cytochrome P450 [Bombardia bombarda]|uniref:Cytochrome P450 n=1 Tax=Bombardia bombarda TaxID=252184 RepID=A0AA39XIB2_9PEZI|nr:cytochrome P450 [Bombardia bombarda]